jgi:probable aminopeptidase NPEPL1
MAAYLTDMPTSELHSDAYLEHIENLAQELNVQKLIIRGQELRIKGFGGLWSVGKAAAHPPALVVLTYTPIKASKTIALVGKGILYDTGGLSIKDRNNMVGMKADMAGSAAILAAFQILVKQNCPYKLHAILCLAENSVGPESTRPDDVIRLYSGKTVEVNNTDAEGRLVLGDGVAYATLHLCPDVVIDVATLTGAQLIVTGKRHGAILTNNEILEKLAFQTGLSSGDLVFPILYCPEFLKKEFQSEIADMKNSVKDRANAQSSCAGHFIEDHLASDFKGAWMHLDIAGPAFRDDRGTGFGVAFLVQLLSQSLDTI